MLSVDSGSYTLRPIVNALKSICKDADMKEELKKAMKKIVLKNSWAKKKWKKKIEKNFFRATKELKIIYDAKQGVLEISDKFDAGEERKISEREVEEKILQSV